MGFNGCLFQETVWIGRQVGMPFKIGSEHKHGIMEFVYNADVSAFLKRKLVGFGVDR